MGLHENSKTRSAANLIGCAHSNSMLVATGLERCRCHVIIITSHSMHHHCPEGKPTWSQRPLKKCGTDVATLGYGWSMSILVWNPPILKSLIRDSRAASFSQESRVYGHMRLQRKHQTATVAGDE